MTQQRGAWPPCAMSQATHLHARGPILHFCDTNVPECYTVSRNAPYSVRLLPARPIWRHRQRPTRKEACLWRSDYIPPNDAVCNISP
jgi:hypothetical protein